MQIRFYDQLLGKGSYGNVFPVEYQNQIRAAKIIDINDDILDVLVREVILLQYLQDKSEYVPTLFAFGILESTQFVLILEQCYVPHKIPNVLICLKQVCQALQTFHDNHVIHRDLVLANVMVRPNGKLCLIDTGMSSFGCGFACRDSFTNLVTTISTRAPELISDNHVYKYSYEIDIFSAAVTAMQLSGIKTFERNPTVRTYQNDVLSVIHSKARDKVLLWMLSSEPSERPKIDEAVKALAGIRDEQFQWNPFQLQNEKSVLRTIQLEPANDTTPTKLCKTHYKYSAILVKTFQEFLHGHTSCLRDRTEKLAEVICTGSCRTTAVISFLIVWCLHQRMNTHLIQQLKRWAQLDDTTFKQIFGNMLIRAATHVHLWLEPCTQQANV